MSTIEDVLQSKGLELPAAPKPAGAYVPVVRTGDLLFVAGQLPLKDGELLASGPVGASVTVEQAQQAAAQCLLNGLAIVRGELDGDLSRVRRIVRIGVFVHCEAGFAQQPRVADGASELAVELFGERGRHARAAVGVNALPRNASVELELVVEAG